MTSMHMLVQHKTFFNTNQQCMKIKLWPFGCLLCRALGLVYDLLVVCTWFLENFNNSKVSYELGDVMFNYSPFCFLKPPWYVHTRCWVIFVLMVTNPLQNACCISNHLLVTRPCEMWMNGATKLVFLFRDKVVLLLACDNFNNFCYHHECWGCSLFPCRPNMQKATSLRSL
jgi:hypothetical protein